MNDGSSNEETGDLLPCPFCGNNNILFRGVSGLGYVECSNCYATVGGENNFYEDAKRHWNTRAQSTPPFAVSQSDAKKGELFEIRT